MTTASPTIATASIDDLISPESDNTRLFVFSCGYEARSIELLKRISNRENAKRTLYLCFSFTTFKESCSRPANEKTLEELGIVPIEVEPNNSKFVVETILSKIGELSQSCEGNPTVHIDYSSMPRNWYCAIISRLMFSTPGLTFFCWYTGATYEKDEYPCVGYGEFKIFSGHPRLSSTSETHIFGLGFDGTRSYGIWNFLDSQDALALVGKTDENDYAVDKVYTENQELISASKLVLSIRIDDFSRTLSSVIDLSREYSKQGDVALIPDGPKPLTLAMSLAPELLPDQGVFSWHVGHIKPKGYQPTDALPNGQVYGFRVRC